MLLSFPWTVYNIFSGLVMFCTGDNYNTTPDLEYDKVQFDQKHENRSLFFHNTKWRFPLACSNEFNYKLLASKELKSLEAIVELI